MKVLRKDRDAFGEGSDRLPFLPPPAFLLLSAAPSTRCWDDARLWESGLGPCGAWLCNAGGRSRSWGEAPGILCTIRDVPSGGTSGRCHPPPSWRGRTVEPGRRRHRPPPCSPQLPEGDVLVEAEAVVALLLRHVAPLLPARHKPVRHRRHRGTPPSASPPPRATLPEDGGHPEPLRLLAHVQCQVSSHTSHPGAKQEIHHEKVFFTLGFLLRALMKSKETASASPAQSSRLSLSVPSLRQGAQARSQGSCSSWGRPSQRGSAEALPSRRGTGGGSRHLSPV